MDQDRSRLHHFAELSRLFGLLLRSPGCVCCYQREEM